MTKIKTNITSHKQTNRNKILNFNFLNKILFGLIIIFGLTYIFCTNNLSVKSFRIQELKKQISYFDNENANYEVQLMNLNSYKTLDEKIAKLDMVAVGEIEYITGAGSVAIQR